VIGPRPDARRNAEVKKMKRIALPLLIALVAGSLPAGAKLVHQTVAYTQGGTPMEGYLAYDDAQSGPRPGVLIVHQWMGLTDNERMRADMLAQLGYVAFAADIYGKGVRPADQAAASAESRKYFTDRALYRARLTAALERLKQERTVDPARIAAIGYCFGGAGVLELARSGAPIAGVVSFHGVLDTPTPADAMNIKAKVLVCQGADDPYAKPEQVKSFEDEMRAAKVDYQIIVYGGAVHAFTQKEAGNDPSKGAAYNADADRRSWQHMKDFFAEIFK
jgi:dienelactone hydrolase